ncbi:butyrophilin subfamily 1 member A1 [Larimichthys crocea]|uniref:butyrophilin subfamily 1 member A1 n=1 Tax=Larimichthys crocea TaxID=215358 RepID=UPI000F5D9C06|nr:butyrophilin subfamily 1 member A1 [Larimichthys crocea]
MTFGDFTVLRLHHTVVLFVLLQSRGGEPQVIGPSQPIVAILGEDIILPCRLEPPRNASGMVVEWARPDLSPGYVYVRRNSKEHVAHKQPSYRGRTSVSINKLEVGDASMKLSEVTRPDEGTYRCLFPQLGQYAFVELVVGAVSSPVISSMSTTSSREVVLQCEAKGWYPEPEVFWLDAEGNLLSAGPTETVRGPDDLYTVSRRLTVEKSDNFTCRVQQKNITQTRETHFTVYLPVPVLAPYAKCILASGLICVFLYAAFIVQECRMRNKEVPDDLRGP